jgi:K+ transporter
VTGSDRVRSGWCGKWEGRGTGISGSKSGMCAAGPHLRMYPRPQRRRHPQVYVPLVNAALFILCCLVVGGFRDTVALGKAYGLAVMTDMLTTTCLVTLVSE